MQDELTVRKLTVSEREPRDVFLQGLTEVGVRVHLVWSGRTGQLYTVPFGQDDPVLEIYGRVGTWDEAQELGQRCPRDSGGCTLVDTLRYAFE